MIPNGSGVIVLSVDKQTDKQTRKWTLLKTVPPSWRGW